MWRYVVCESRGGGVEEGEAGGEEEGDGGGEGREGGEAMGGWGKGVELGRGGKVSWMVFLGGEGRGRGEVRIGLWCGWVGRRWRGGGGGRGGRGGGTWRVGGGRWLEV